MTHLTPEEVRQNWPNWVRLVMIEKSEFYQNPNVYQYGFYDGYQLAQAQLKSERERSAKLLEALEDSILVIKQWHNCDEVWDLYFKNAPEMKPIRDAITEYKNKP